MNSTSKYFSFHVFNLLGWIIYGCADLFMKFKATPFDTSILLGHLITYIAGIITTIGLRYIYKCNKKQPEAILPLFVYMLLISALFGLIWFHLDYIFSIPLHGYNVILSNYERIPVIEYSSYNMIIIMAWSGLYFGFRYFLDYQNQVNETKLALTRVELAELKLLRYQINPHFLFNALSSLRTLIREDQDKAESMLERISEFLRYTMVNNDAKEVSLETEIDALKNYLEIEKVKYEKELDIRMNISPTSAVYPIPFMLLHPLVENAIKHGSLQNGIKRIEIESKIVKDYLNISIISSGAWKDQHESDKKIKTQLGLSNVKQRLSRYYPETYDFEIIKSDTQVKVNISYRKNLNEQ